MSDEQEIVPVVVQALRPRSVIHYGCGDGAMLAAFKAAGVGHVLGVDEAPACPHLGQNEYRQASLQQACPVPGPFDLAISLEVGEHIPASASDVYVERLVRLSPVILFSAAIPVQGGKNHVNEQWPTYWAEKFSRFGYALHDVVRPVFWDNRRVSVWFRQNLFLVVRAEDQGEAVDAFRALCRKPVLDMVHPDLYVEKASRLEQILYGRAGIATYVRLLAKAVLARCGLYRRE